MSAGIAERPVETHVVDRARAERNFYLAPSAPTYPNVPVAPAKPEIRVDVRVRERRRARPNRLAAAVAYAVGFGLLTLVAAGASTLAGQVMMEQARHDNLRAHTRARAAMQDVRSLRGELEAMTSDASVSAWAAAHGFQPADAATSGIQTKAKNLVAVNP